MPVWLRAAKFHFITLSSSLELRSLEGPDQRLHNEGEFKKERRQEEEKSPSGLEPLTSRLIGRHSKCVTTSAGTGIGVPWNRVTKCLEKKCYESRSNVLQICGSFFKCQTIFLLIFATGFLWRLVSRGQKSKVAEFQLFFHAKLFLCLGLRVIGRHVADFIVQPGRQPNANTRQGLSRFELLRRPQKIACHCQSDFDGKRRQTRLEEMNVYDDNSPSSCTNHFF